MNLKETLKTYGITSVWHFTDRSNLASIKKNGLLSLALLTRNGINVSCYGADGLSHSLDRRKGIDKYVHLSIVKSHPMQYVKVKNGDIPNPIWLEIDISVLFENESLCCDGIANASSSQCYDIEQLDEVVNLKSLTGKKSSSNSTRKAQLLVANKIAYNKIKGIYNGKQTTIFNNE